MLAFLTGATGFVGSHVAEALVSKGYTVRCLARKTSDTKWLQPLLQQKSIELVEGSLAHEHSLRSAVRDVDLVVHVAGVTAARTREEFFQGNQIGTRNLLHATLQVNPSVKRFLHVSSQTAVGPAPSLQEPATSTTPCRPITRYGESKKAAEEEVFALQHQLPVTIVRPPAVYGQRDTAVFDYFKAVHGGLAPLIGFDTKYVSLVHVEDLARGIVMAAESQNTISKSYFVSSDEFYTWPEITAITKRILNKKFVLQLRLPHSVVMGIAGISGFFGRFASKPPVLDFEKGKDIIQRYWICSTKEAHEDFGYSQQITLEEGISKTIHWYREQGWLS